MHQRIAAAIRRSPLTQTEIGHRLGLSKQAMSDRMVGRTRWSLADVVEIAAILEVSVDDLISLDDDLPLGFTLAEATA